MWRVLAIMSQINDSVTLEMLHATVTRIIRDMQQFPLQVHWKPQRHLLSWRNLSQPLPSLTIVWVKVSFRVLKMGVVDFPVYQQSKTILCVIAQPVSVQSPGNRSGQHYTPLHTVHYTPLHTVCACVCWGGKYVVTSFFIEICLFCHLTASADFPVASPQCIRRSICTSGNQGSETSTRCIYVHGVCQEGGGGGEDKSWCNLATDYSLWTMPIAEAASSSEQPSFACNLREIFHHFPSHFQMLTQTPGSASTAASNLSSSFLCSALLLSVSGTR